MNGSTNMCSPTSTQAATCTSACVAKRNAANTTERMIGEGNCPIIARLKSVQPLLTPEHAWVIGRVDTLIGKKHKQAMVTLTERKSRFTFVSKVKRQTAPNVRQAICKLLLPVKDKLRKS